ncbi:uncharacterized protein AKAW2_80711S [Aspergillus luchuensis]|uniref:Uncharacterized protein n=1 Tax=Aspergillus kawachii TaxID=1069201 RepID=A0A7R7WLJ3_ASPKA|nr:uncharacterized protein AKAW2_80711S [Aspergillus luchuensis]BCS04910.1 hypothetical protein AKAW2_80711S [Aspergillus luchuensis]
MGDCFTVAIDDVGKQAIVHSNSAPVTPDASIPRILLLKLLKPFHHSKTLATTSFTQKFNNI